MEVTVKLFRGKTLEITVEKNSQKLDTSTIEAVVFDFSQTLVDLSDGLRMAEKTAQKKLAAELEANSVDLDPERFLADYRRMRKEFQESSNYSRASLWLSVGRHYGHEADLTVLRQWESEYWQQIKDRTRLFEETFDVLGKLREKYRLAAITNTQGQEQRERHRFDELPELESFFEVIIVAGDGTIPPKPDPTPFRDCLAKLGVAPDRAAYVGDDWRNDVCGAREVGMHPIWLKHRSIPRRWPDVSDPAPVVFDLNELLDLLSTK